MCNNLLDCYKYPPPTQRRKAVLWIRSRSEALPGKAWDSDQHRQPEQGNLPPTTESRWSQRKPAATWLTLSLPPGRTVSSGLYKNFDYPEKPLKYKHIRRISDWFYYQFTTFNGLRLDMPEHLASMKQPNTNATHWRRGTSAITQFHIAPHWRRYLIPTGKQGTPLFFYPHVTQ